MLGIDCSSNEFNEFTLNYQNALENIVDDAENGVLK